MAVTMELFSSVCWIIIVQSVTRYCPEALGLTRRSFSVDGRWNFLIISLWRFFLLFVTFLKLMSKTIHLNGLFMCIVKCILGKSAAQFLDCKEWRLLPSDDVKFSQSSLKEKLHPAANVTSQFVSVIQWWTGEKLTKISLFRPHHYNSFCQCDTKTGDKIPLFWPHRCHGDVPYASWGKHSNYFKYKWKYTER